MRLELRVSSLSQNYGELKENPKELVFQKRKKRIRLPKIWTCELAWLLGLMHGDGNTSGKRLLFTDKCKKFQEVIHRVFKKIFGVQLNLFHDKNRHSYYSHTKNRLLYAFFTETLEVPKGAVRKNLKIPKFVKRFNSKLKAAYICGLFDAEGSVRKRQAQVSFYTTTKELFEFVGNFLKNKKIEFSTYTRKRGKKKEFEIHVYGRDDLARFNKFVELKHPEKRKRLTLFLGLH